jgi:hypothetical protein
MIYISIMAIYFRYSIQVHAVQQSFFSQPLSWNMLAVHEIHIISSRRDETSDLEFSY